MFNFIQSNNALCALSLPIYNVIRYLIYLLTLLVDVAFLYHINNPFSCLFICKSDIMFNGDADCSSQRKFAFELARADRRVPPGHISKPPLFLRHGTKVRENEQDTFFSHGNYLKTYLKTFLGYTDSSFISRKFLIVFFYSLLKSVVSDFS